MKHLASPAAVFRVTLLDVLSEGILSAPRQLGKDGFSLENKFGSS